MTYSGRERLETETSYEYVKIIQLKTEKAILPGWPELDNIHSVG
jgi:hypothetical protein